MMIGGRRNSVPGSGNSMREGPSVRNHLDAYIFQGLRETHEAEVLITKQRMAKGGPREYPKAECSQLCWGGRFYSEHHESVCSADIAQTPPIVLGKRRVTMTL